MKNSIFSATAFLLFSHLSSAGIHAEDFDPAYRKPVIFSFRDTGRSESGDIQIANTDIFNVERGYGYDFGSSMDKEGDPFYFSVLADDGNYKVTIEFGHESSPSSNTVKAESRRLLLEGVETRSGEYATRSVIVNIRDANLTPPEEFAPGGRVVVLNDREIGKLIWDRKLTLEFNGPSPHVRSIRVEQVEVPTVYLIGDSTVTDQPDEPAASWGQMLPRFFTNTVAVANHAESGETMKSFISGLRLAKVLESIKKGDYLFIQFTHNDQKAQWPQTYVEAGSTYKAYLRVLIEEARLREATPVLVTSMQRRRFDKAGTIVNTLGEYPMAMREVAEEENVALIDLESMSVALYEALGVDKAPLAFNDGGRDATHHNNYGAYQLAKCVVQGIIDAKLPLSESIAEDFSGYDPSCPDDIGEFHIEPSLFPGTNEQEGSR